MAWSWYTKGRRIPTLIGKDVSGRRIPGGPYTGLQAVTAAAVPALLWSTRSLWAAEMAGLAMFAVLVGVTVAAVKLVGKVDFASRNPLLLLGGYLRQTGRPAAGTLAGRKLAEPKPHRATGTVNVAHIPRDEPSTATHRSAAAVTAPATATDGPAAAEPAAAVPVSAAADGGPAHLAEPATMPVTETTAVLHQPSPMTDDGAASGKVAAALRPAAPLAPDRRRTGLEAFLAGAAASRDATPEEDAA